MDSDVPDNNSRGRGVPAACSPELTQFLNADTEAAADTHLNYLQREFITPLVISTIARELRRGPTTTYRKVWVDDESFREIQATVEGSIAARLRRIRNSQHARTEPIGTINDLAGYVCAAARHGCDDYMRQRRPGRHSLDTALRAALGAADDLVLWRERIQTDLYTWRCGYTTWQTESRPVHPLRNDRGLQERLWAEMRKYDGTRAQAVRHILELVGAPLFYSDLLDLLCALWDVEKPYLAAAGEYADVRVQLAQAAQRPEAAAMLLGTLTAVWDMLRPLGQIQKAVLLLRLPPSNHRNFVEEFVRLGVASDEEIAGSIGLSVEELRFQYSMLPLSDDEIAVLIGIEPGDVRRIRLDARRRLRRIHGKL